MASQFFSSHIQLDFLHGSLNGDGDVTPGEWSLYETTGEAKGISCYFLKRFFVILI